MNAIVYSFIHSINHPTIQQTFIDSKCLFTRHFLSTKDAKINRAPQPHHVISTCRPGNYSFQQTWEGNGEGESGTKKKCCNCQLVLKEWPHKWSHMHRKWKKCLDLLFKNYKKVICGFFLALLLLFSIFYKTSQSNCISVSLSEGWSIFWNPFYFLQPPDPLPIPYFISKVIWGENQLD